jgi:hypothetical protein
LDSISEVDLNNGGGLRSLSADDDLVINSSSRFKQINFAHLLQLRKANGLENKKKKFKFWKTQRKRPASGLRTKFKWI